MPPTTIWRNRETRVSHRQRFVAALGANQNRCDRIKGDAYRHQYSQKCPNVVGGLDDDNLANGRAILRGAAVFLNIYCSVIR